MASYTYEEKGVLLSTPIEAVLSFYGKDTSHDRTYHYFSPFREETNRSFHVNPRENVWYDFGLAEGGGVLTLVIKLAGCEAEETQQQPPQEEVTIAEKKTEEPPKVVVTRQSSSISTLDNDFSSGGMSSLDDESTLAVIGDSHPFKCMFAKEGKVKNGQRVSVILLEDIMVGGIPVPNNTHLMARCKLSDRLELEFENIEIGGRILDLGYEAYDVDGSRGIYCPDVSGTGKQVRSRGSNIISSTLTGRMGRIAREVLSTGVSIAQSAGGEITVSVPTGYTFYIVKIQR